MVLTRWARNDGTLVTPIEANYWSGAAQIPVTTGELDFNMYALIDADLGAVFALRPNRTVATVYWQAILSLVVTNASSKSAFGGNPIRRKLGNITYAQGLFPISFQAINYALCILERQGFLFAEGLPEPSLGVLSTLPPPEARDYIFTPRRSVFFGSGSAIDATGATRAQLSIEPGIIGVAEFSYIVLDDTSAFLGLDKSLLVSQL